MRALIAGLCFLAASLTGCISPVIKAAQSGDQSRMDQLLKSSADVDAESNGLTPLVAASAAGDKQMVHFLLDHGAKPNFRAEGGWSPLFAAVYYRHADSAELLVNSGAEVTSEAMGQARASGQVDLYKFLSDNFGRRPVSTTELQHAVSAALERAKQKGPVPKSDVDTPSYSRPENANDLAIVVGIEKYADPDLPDADFADHDAEAVKAHLIALGFAPRNVKLLYGERATKSELTAYLEQWLPARVSTGSLVFFYFSGHGAPAADSGEAYLVPFDGDPEYLADTSYPLRRLYAKLNRLPAKQVVVALDSCFSGAGGRSVLARGTRPLVTKADAWLLGQGHVTALTASKTDQVSGTMDSQGHGIFTYYLLKGLNGAAAVDGHVTVRQLYDYLGPKVDDQASATNRTQTPQLLPADAKDFRLR